MTNKKWFFNVSGQVSGPFSVNEIEDMLSMESSALIWSRGFSEWMKPDEWRTRKDEIPGLVEAEQPVWRYRIDGKVHGPYTATYVADLLSNREDFDHIDVSYSDGPWKELFTVSVLAEKLGLSRRAHNRVPILGVVHLDTENESKDYRAITISEGGIGLTDVKDLEVGQKVKGYLKSANLYVEVHFIGDVVYVGSDGYVGIKFSNLPPESQGAIIEYINKFKS